MGFPSPADYVEERISLDKRLIAHPSATYMMVAGTTYLRAGIMKGPCLSSIITDTERWFSACLCC
jgi:DNA polymerase V